LVRFSRIAMNRPVCPSLAIRCVAGLALSTGHAAFGMGLPGPLPPTSREMQMPMLAFGTGDTHCAPDCASAVSEALRLGFRHIDTAYEYGSQKAVAAGIQVSGVPRSEIFITTKIPGPVGTERAAELLRQGLRELNTSYIDLLLMHYPCDTSYPDPRDACNGTDGMAARLETWRAMEAMKTTGLVRHIGVSNYHVRHLEHLLAPGNNVSAPFVNQVEWHLGWHDEELFNYSKPFGIQVQAYSALGGGGTSTGHNGGIALDDPIVVSIARKHGVSIAQVALRWSLDRGVAIITATTKPSHMQSDLDIYKFSLSAEEVRSLDKLRAAVPSVQIFDDWPDVVMPVIALGTRPRSLDAKCNVSTKVARWFQLGGRHVDTTHSYGSESEVGVALSAAVAGGVAARDELFVTAQIPGPVGKAAAELMESSMLPALNLTYVDLLLMQWPCLDSASPESCSGEDGAADRAATWLALEDLRASGKARSIGVAGFGVAHLDHLLPFVAKVNGSTSLVAVNQVEWHLGWHDEELLAYCQKHGIRLQARSPLGGPGASHGHGHLSSEAVQAAARKYGVTPAQVALRWSLQRGVPVVTSGTEQTHMVEDLSPLFVFSLSTSELDILSNLSTASTMLEGMAIAI